MRCTVLVGVSAWLLLAGVAGPAGALTDVADEAGALVSETTDLLPDRDDGDGEVDAETGVERRDSHTLARTTEALGDTVETTVDDTLSEGIDLVHRLVEGTVGQPPPDPGDGLDVLPLPSRSGDDAEPPTIAPPTRPGDAGGAEPAATPADRADAGADEPLVALLLDRLTTEDEPAPVDLSGLGPLPESDVGLSPLAVPDWLMATAASLLVAVSLGHALSARHRLRRA